MKFDWIRTRCVSVAECGDLAAILNCVDRGGKRPQWYWEVRSSLGKLLAAGLSEDRVVAERECEEAVDAADKPQWKQSEPWLWSTTWRGVFAYCRESEAGTWDGFYAAPKGYWQSVKRPPSAAACMAEVESEIRKRTGDAECSPT